MIKSLELYFIQNGYLDLPSIGSIKLSMQEAECQDNILHAPQETIVFDPNGDKPTKDFYNFIADRLDISVEQAAVKLDQLIQTFKSKTVATLEIGSLGVIQKQADHYKWTSFYQGVDYYQNLSLAAINTNHTLLDDFDNNNTNKWIKWALALFVLALTLIFYKQL